VAKVRIKKTKERRHIMDMIAVTEIYTRIEKLNTLMIEHKLSHISDSKFVLAIHKGTDDLLEYVPRDPRND